MGKHKVVISCGPIPSRLDSVKFITNRFKGGLAFKTAEAIINTGKYDVTIVIWKHTPLPHVNGQTLGDYWMQDGVHVVTVNDVVEYYNWYRDNAADYDAFIMAAAVANLMPSEPWEGKFPSHKYKVGDKFDIQFEIAPRAIDVIKEKNPRACLIGYKLFDGSDEELIEAARLTQKESKANIIFANSPQTAKEKKLAVMADNTVLEVSFDQHIDMIFQQLDAEYFRTIIQPLTDAEASDAAIREALATVKMYEQTFNGFGTVAVPVPGKPDMFATTSRGHRGEPVIVRSVDVPNHTVTASGKATLNAPTLYACLFCRAFGDKDVIVVHRHDNDPNFLLNKAPFDVELDYYCFPGTVEEVQQVTMKLGFDVKRIKLPGHGDLSILPINAPDWTKYYTQFPSKYFSTPAELEELIAKYAGTKTLELGANRESKAQYVYDKFVQCPTAINLSAKEARSFSFDFVYAKNAINYMELEFLREVIARTEHFAANTFLQAPAEKISGNEAAVSDEKWVYHSLRLPDDSLVRHRFHNYTRADYEALGLAVRPYGKNSALLLK